MMAVMAVMAVVVVVVQSPTSAMVDAAAGAVGSWY